MSLNKKEQIKVLLLEGKTFVEIQKLLEVSSVTVAQCSKDLAAEKLEMYQCVIDVLLDRKEKLKGANAKKKVLYEKALRWIEAAKNKVAL